jgi:hypothetical protein
MSERPEWKGGRIGPYEIGKRYPGIDEEEGRLYEARHVETGEPALAVMPGTGEEWRTSHPWDVRTLNFARSEVLMVHPRRRPGQPTPSLHELSLGYIRAAAALSLLDSREDAQNLFSRSPAPPRSRSPVLRWGLACASVALSVLVVFLLWPAASTRLESNDLLGESLVFVDGQEPTPSAIAYPLPEKPFKEQRIPPCIEGRDTEIRGGCWVKLEAKAPCPKSTAEFEGNCYLPVEKPKPLPSSVKP